MAETWSIVFASLQENLTEILLVSDLVAEDETEDSREENTDCGLNDVEHVYKRGDSAY